jgi:hypothetical protein
MAQHGAAWRSMAQPVAAYARLWSRDSAFDYQFQSGHQALLVTEIVALVVQDFYLACDNCIAFV